MRLVNDEIKIYNLSESILNQSLYINGDIEIPEDIRYRRLFDISDWANKYPNNECGNIDVSNVKNGGDLMYLRDVYVSGIIVVPKHEYDNIYCRLSSSCVDVYDNRYCRIIKNLGYDESNCKFLFYQRIVDEMLEEGQDSICYAVIRFSDNNPISYRIVKTNKDNTLMDEDEKFFEYKDVINKMYGSMTRENPVIVYISTNYNQVRLVHTYINTKVNYKESFELFLEKLKLYKFLTGGTE